MSGLEDIRGRLGVAYQALRCFSLSLISFFLIFLLFPFFLTRDDDDDDDDVRSALSLSLSPSFSPRASLQKRTITNYRGRAALREQRNPFTLPVYKIVDHTLSSSRVIAKRCIRTYILVRVSNIWSNDTEKTGARVLRAIWNGCLILSEELPRRATTPDATREQFANKRTI